MSDSPVPTARSSSRLPRLPTVLVGVLLVMATVAAAGGIAVAVAVQACRPEEDAPATSPIWTIVPIAAGGVLAAVLWAMAWLIRQACRDGAARLRTLAAVEHLAAAVEANARRSGFVQSVPLEGDAPVQPTSRDSWASPDGGSAGLSAPLGASGDAVAALLAELKDLNVNVLLGEAERQAKRQALVQQRTAQLDAQVLRAIDAGDLPGAREGLDELRRFAPHSERIEPLAERLERAAQEIEARQVAEATDRAEDLMSVGEFGQALQAAEDLLARHPSLPAAIALVDRVRREGAAYAAEHRRRMADRLHKAAGVRHWREAREAAEDLIRAYPESREADVARSQMETLRANARFEYARELRDQIRDLLARRRFAEALEAARRVLREFPDTTMAEELKGQMARLEELAAKGDAGGEAKA